MWTNFLQIYLDGSASDLEWVSFEYIQVVCHILSEIMWIIFIQEVWILCLKSTLPVWQRGCKIRRTYFINSSQEKRKENIFKVTHESQALKLSGYRSSRYFFFFTNVQPKTLNRYPTDAIYTFGEKCPETANYSIWEDDCCEHVFWASSWGSHIEKEESCKPFQVFLK